MKRTRKLVTVAVLAVAVVDQLDITIAQAFYQARSTDIDWNTSGANGAAPSACDVTGDSVVDIQDLIAIYLNFTA